MQLLFGWWETKWQTAPFLFQTQLQSFSPPPHMVGQGQFWSAYYGFCLPLFLPHAFPQFQHRSSMTLQGTSTPGSGVAPSNLPSLTTLFPLLLFSLFVPSCPLSLAFSAIPATLQHPAAKAWTLAPTTMPHFKKWVIWVIWRNYRGHTFCSVLVEKSAFSPSFQKRTWKECFGPPNEEIVSFQLGNYVISRHQKLRPEIEANSLSCSTADEGESGKLKGNSMYQPSSLNWRHQSPEVWTSCLYRRSWWLTNTFSSDISSLIIFKTTCWN